MFYDFITKYTNIFVEKMREAFLTILQQKYWQISDINRVATVRENIWKMKFFPGQGKVMEFYGWSGKFRKNLERQGKAEEFENKWLWQAVFRKFIDPVPEDKGCTFSRDSLSPSPSALDATLKGKNKI